MSTKAFLSGAVVGALSMVVVAAVSSPFGGWQQPEQTTKAKAEHKTFAKHDEVREFPKGRVELIKIGGAMIGRGVFQPGWRWSESVQPIVKTKSCEAPHFQYHLAGVLRVKMDDGSVFDCKPGDVSLLPSGHDAWVVGDEPVIVIDFQGMIDYAKGGGR